MNSAIGNFDSSGIRHGSDQTPENGNVVPVAPVVSENVTIDALKYVSKEEYDNLCALCATMLANGATLYELQQRIMGFE